MSNELYQNCKYLLPCGYCDKKGSKCPVYFKQVNDLNENTTLTNPAEHDHCWETLSVSTKGITYVCKVCGKQMFETIEEKYGQAYNW